MIFLCVRAGRRWSGSSDGWTQRSRSWRPLLEVPCAFPWQQLLQTNDDCFLSNDSINQWTSQMFPPKEDFPSLLPEQPWKPAPFLVRVSVNSPSSAAWTGSSSARLSVSDLEFCVDQRDVGQHLKLTGFCLWKTCFLIHSVPTHHLIHLNL